MYKNRVMLLVLKILSRKNANLHDYQSLTLVKKYTVDFILCIEN